MILFAITVEKSKISDIILSAENKYGKNWLNDKFS